jgi:hypothetical protein
MGKHLEGQVRNRKAVSGRPGTTNICHPCGIQFGTLCSQEGDNAPAPLDNNPRDDQLRSFAMSAVIFAVSLFTGIGVWLLGMRPYLRQHGGTVATGANLWVGGWVDWQQCRDFGRAKQDSRALRWSNLFLLTQLGIAVAIVLALCGV